MLDESIRTCVAKVGGSLLDSVQTRGRLESWLTSRASVKIIFVVGGGKRVDRVRDWERRHSLKTSESHWHAIEMMQLNALRVASWFPSWVWMDDFWDLASGGPAQRIIFAPKHWLTTLDDPLPESWDVTSDSIAARLALDLEADELILLKSADPPPGATMQNLADVGYVDRFFPQVIKNRSVRLVNLRNLAASEVVIEAAAKEEA
jgi:aspartokinase-like uncharacterized kinase